MTHTMTFTSTLVYIIGAPGAGKSTLMADLTRRATRTAADGRVPYDVLTLGREQVALEMGKRRLQFAGTDAMSMAVQPLAESWIAARPAPLVLGEGMRLANLKFFKAAATAGYRVKVVYIEINPTVLEEQRRARGAAQSERWLAGATSRAHNLAEAVDHDESHELVRLPHASVRSMTANLVAKVPELEVLV